MQIDLLKNSALIDSRFVKERYRICFERLMSYQHQQTDDRDLFNGFNNLERLYTEEAYC